MKRLLFLSIILSLLVCSCVKNKYIDDSEDGCIVFGVKTYTVETRGTPLDVSGMRDMGVIAYYTGNGDTNTWSSKGLTATPNLLSNIKINKNNGDVWSSTVKYYWPQAEDAKCTFFAYAPYATTANGITITNTTGVPTLTYTVPPTCTAQPDLMVAVPRIDLNKASSTGAVSFTMKHALTCIGFKVQGGGERISKIAVKGVRVSGSLSLDGTNVVWNPLDPASDTGYTSGTTDGLKASYTMSNAMNADGYLMMIPQTLGANAKVIITVNGTDKEISLAGQTWTPGQQIMYNLTIQSDGVEITNGGMTLIWAVGNLVANGNGGCKIGAPEDGGLYFQFGSLIGWAGGATGDGTGRGNDPGVDNLGKGQARPALKVMVNNTNVGPQVGDTTWVTTAGVTYWDGSEAIVPLNSSGAVGDPCRHYLGGTWRLPTQAEMRALFDSPLLDRPPYYCSLDSITNWSRQGSFNFGSTTSYAVYDDGTTRLKMPAAGMRRLNDGTLGEVGKRGAYYQATASPNGTTGGYVGFYTNVVPFSNGGRWYAYTVRCVRDTR